MAKGDGKQFKSKPAGSFGSADIRDPLQAARAAPLSASVSVSPLPPPPQPASATATRPRTRARSAGRRRRIGAET